MNDYVVSECLRLSLFVDQNRFKALVQCKVFEVSEITDGRKVEKWWLRTTDLNVVQSRAATNDSFHYQFIFFSINELLIILPSVLNN